MMDRIGRTAAVTEERMDLYETASIALVETEAELNAVQRELDRVEAEIRAAIECVQNPIYQAYLRMRFLAYKSERQIAAETNYSSQYIGSVVRKKAIDSVNIPANTR